MSKYVRLDEVMRFVSNIVSDGGILILSPEEISFKSVISSQELLSKKDVEDLYRNGLEFSMRLNRENRELRCENETIMNQLVGEMKTNLELKKLLNRVVTLFKERTDVEYCTECCDCSDVAKEIIEKWEELENE